MRSNRFRPPTSVLLGDGTRRHGGNTLAGRGSFSVAFLSSHAKVRSGFASFLRLSFVDEEIHRLTLDTSILFTDEGGEMAPQEDKEFPFALMDISPTPGDNVDNSQLAEIVKSTPTNIVEPSPETHLEIAAQVIIPFIIAGMGMVGAGFYLDHVQCQAIVVGMMSAVVAIVMVLITQQKFEVSHTLLLCSCSIITSSIASLLLGFITATVIIMSRFFKINPDNVATPIAASLGDITSLVLLSWVASKLYGANGKVDFDYSQPSIMTGLKSSKYFEKSVYVYFADKIWISPAIIGCYILVIPFWIFIAKKNKYTQAILYTGWTPVILAMFISTFAGFILDILMDRHSAIAVYQPVINGVGGNLVSVQASRLSTKLHKENELGTLPPTSRICISPLDAFLSKEQFATTARVLLFLVVPGHLIFVYTIRYFQGESASPSSMFVASYLAAALIQVAILLYVAYVITYYFWKQKVNPDNSTIPYLTALGDLLGIILLGVTFEFLGLMGDKQNPT
ncbi:hypothetical protein C0J52_00885 [Blattella germanica]|nr:hypothetical protein C0J52_00885 [Blattella germanica]